MRSTFLRDSFYLDFMPAMVGADGVIRGPAGDGRVAVVAREDVARCAAEVLRHPSDHVDATYTLTGPESLTLTEVAETLTLYGERAVAFSDETVAEAYESRASYGAPGWQNDAWVSTYTSIAQGEVAPVTDDVERITGSAPVSLADFLAR